MALQYVRRTHRQPPIRQKVDTADRPSTARLRAAIERIRRSHARAAELLADVFGSSCVAAIARRVSRLAAADRLELHRTAGEVRLLATWMSAVTEAIELEDGSAAELRPYLEAIMSECDLIASIDHSAAA